MLVPLFGFIVGVALFSITLSIYLGISFFKRFSWLYQFKKDRCFLWGGSAISIALLLGLVGYFNYADSSSLRIVRMALGVLGIVLTSFSIVNQFNFINQLGEFKAIRQYFNSIVDCFKGFDIPTLLSVASIILLSSIFLISFFDANYGGDAFMYHIPFAGRLWGIITPEQYVFEHNTEHRFLGFPLLANFLQGFFWFIFQRPEATNVLCYVSLLLLVAYLVSYLKIPFYLATISMLAVPMVHMHAARSYIDLPGNVCVSILILTTYLLYIGKIKFSLKNLTVIFLSAAAAANMKFQLIPVIFIILCFTFAKLVLDYWKNSPQSKGKITGLTKLLAVSFVASLVIFATPIKNIAFYQNPFYPVKVSIAGFVLNHNEAPPDFMHESIRKLPPTLRWTRSILEINAFDSRRPWPWTLGMDFISWEEPRFGMGGYFGGYVIFNLILFIYLCLQHKNLDSKIAVRLMIIMTLLTSIMPQSYELRYYMYWMIVFVSLNCYLTCRLVENSPQKISWVTPRNFGLVATAFMLIFITKTRYFFTVPEFSSFEKQVQRTDIIDQDILKNLKNGDQICLVGKTPHPFLYTSYFNPPHNYSIKAEFDMPQEYIDKHCEGWKVVR